MFSAVKHVLSEAYNGAAYLVGSDPEPVISPPEIKPFQPDVPIPTEDEVQKVTPDTPVEPPAAPAAPAAPAVAAPAPVAVAVPATAPEAPKLAPTEPTPAAVPEVASAAAAPVDDFALSKWSSK